MSGLTKIVIGILAASYIASPNDAEARLMPTRIVTPIITYDEVVNKVSPTNQLRKDARELIHHGNNFYRQGDYKAAIDKYTRSLEILNRIKGKGIPDFDVFDNAFYLGEVYYVAAANGSASNPAEKERYCRNAIHFLSMAKDVIDLYSKEFGHSQAMATFSGSLPYYDRYMAGSYELTRDLVNYSRHFLRYYGVFPNDVDIAAFTRQIAAEASEKELTSIFELISGLEDRSAAAGLKESIKRYRELTRRSDKIVGQ